MSKLAILLPWNWWAVLAFHYLAGLFAIGLGGGKLTGGYEELPWLIPLVFTFVAGTACFSIAFVILTERLRIVRLTL